MRAVACLLLGAGLTEAFVLTAVPQRPHSIAVAAATDAQRGRPGTLSLNAACEKFCAEPVALTGSFTKHATRRKNAQEMPLSWKSFHQWGNFHQRLPRHRDTAHSVHTPRQDPLSNGGAFSGEVCSTLPAQRGPGRSPASGRADDFALPRQKAAAWRTRIFAASAVAGSFLVAFTVEQVYFPFSEIEQTADGRGWQGGTYAILCGLQRATGTESMAELGDWLVAWAATAGPWGVGLSAVGATSLQLLPVFNGIILCMVLGAMWGSVTGVAVASCAACTAAVACLLISRHGLRELIGRHAGRNALMDAIGGSISASFSKSMLVTTMIRLSPVIPYCWSNYLFGLTPIKPLPYALGTAVGTLPSLFVFVSAGVVGKNIASGGATPPPELLAVGAAATLSVMGFLGKVAQQELAKLSKDGGDAGTSLNGGAELPK